MQLHTDFFFISGQKQRRSEEKSEATKTASLQPLRKTRDEIMIDVVFAKEDKLKRSKEKSKALLTFKKNPYLLTKQKIRVRVAAKHYISFYFSSFHFLSYIFLTNGRSTR